MRGVLRALAVLVLGVLGVPVLMLLSGTGSAYPRVGQVSAPAKLDPAVLVQTSEGRHASLVVLMAEQADLSAAPGISDPGARGRYVYSALREYANRSQRDLRSSLDSLGVSYEPLWAVNALVITGDRSLVEMLAQRNDVGAIELNSLFRTIHVTAITGGQSSNVGADAIEWGVQSVNAPQVWAMGYTGQGLVIGNAGTGVRWEHNGLKPHYRGWNGAAADHNYSWWDAVHSSSGPCGANSQAPCDDNGHSTHTTGTAVGDDGGGNQIGVAPGAKWIACRNMDQGSGTPQRFIECFQFFLAPTDLNGQNPALGAPPAYHQCQLGLPAECGLRSRYPPTDRAERRSSGYLR
jgi:serine protease AprX